MIEILNEILKFKKAKTESTFFCAFVFSAAETLLAKIEDLKSSKNFLSSDELEIMMTQHKSQIEQAKSLNKLIQSMKKQGDADDVRRLKKTLSHLKTFLSRASESEGRSDLTNGDESWGETKVANGADFGKDCDFFSFQ